MFQLSLAFDVTLPTVDLVAAYEESAFGGLLAFTTNLHTFLMGVKLTFPAIVLINNLVADTTSNGDSPTRHKNPLYLPAEHKPTQTEIL